MDPHGLIKDAAWKDDQNTIHLLKCLSRDGGVARLVGGCVRNALLATRNSDVDIAVNRPVEQNVITLRNQGIRVIPTGLKNGTVTAVVGARRYHVSSLRVDVLSFGRQVKTQFTEDWVSDAHRRDFTLNAIYADLDGTFYDPVGGLSDLKAGKIRFVGDPKKRIQEDYLRIMRFFRFYAWYGRGEPDSGALAACRLFANKLETLSGERILHEIVRLLGALNPLPAIHFMGVTNVLNQIFPDGFYIDRLTRLLGVDNEIDPLRRLGALACGSYADIECLAQRLPFSNKQKMRLLGMSLPQKDVRKWKDPTNMSVALYKFGRENVIDLAFLEGDMAVVRLAQLTTVPYFPIKGRDVLAIGVSQGPEVGEILSFLEQRWIRGGFKAGRAELMIELTTLIA